jgi:pimeloyl-ACP methyl ester carboxylesterase
MARIVLVHGIAQQQRSADDLEHEWLPSLAGGVRTAEHPDLADQLWPIEPTDRWARMAFYGNLFLTPDQQGHTSNLTNAQRDLADDIATEWLTNALDSTRTRDAGTARQELDALRHDPTDAQGIRGVTARALASLDRIPWFGNAGFHLAGLNAIVGQAVRYLTEPAIREAAIATVHEHLGPDTRVVLAHSLGSVVAYEALHAKPQPLPLLITLGSPLGLASVIRRLQQPPAYPAGLHRWINLADRNDIIAARPKLTTIFDNARPPAAIFESTYTVDNGAEPHRATFYLTKPTIGSAIADALHADTSNR